MRASPTRRPRVWQSGKRLRAARKQHQWPSKFTARMVIRMTIPSSVTCATARPRSFTKAHATFTHPWRGTGPSGLRRRSPPGELCQPGSANTFVHRLHKKIRVICRLPSVRKEHVPRPASDTPRSRISHLRAILKLIPVLVHALGFFEFKLEALYVQRRKRVKFLRLRHAFVILALPQSQTLED